MTAVLPDAANALTALRVLLAPAFVAAVRGAAGAPTLGFVAFALFAICAASDVIDGRVARRRGTVSDAGRTFDHVADIIFLVVALSTYATLGIAPWWVPAAVAASFAFYAVDSWRRRRPHAPSLIGSRLGHAAGVMNYVVVGVLVLDQSAGLQVLPRSVLNGLFWSVPLYSAAAVATRLLPARSRLRLQLALGPAHVGNADPGERKSNQPLGHERH
jgi:CDP-diacylglycerol--glycerol-3-phosphate 3-phosphatidyltransferase